MNSFRKQKYEELITDKGFIRWATGRDHSNIGDWDNWPQRHPGYEAEFDEALKTARLLTFETPKVSDTEIHYQWEKTLNKLNNVDGLNKKNIVRRLILWTGRGAAVLLVPLVVTVVWLYLQNTSVQTENEEMSAYFRSNPVTVKAPMGGMVNLQLPDGTKVWLNAGSEIKYPASFSGSQRVVSMEGEAFFEVEKADVPFVVNNPGPQVRVYGTQFNVNAYNNEENVIVALAEGKVSLKVNHTEQILKPGEISVFNKEKHSLTIKQASIVPFTSWRAGKLIFRDATLTSIVKTLERRYNASIQIADPAVAHYTYNAIVQGETFEQVLDLLALSAPIKYKYIRPKQKEDSSFSKAQVIITKDKTRIINE